MRQKTESENLITEINTDVFFKEFTFDKNEFLTEENHYKELADSIIVLDDLLFILQIKERQRAAIKTSVEEAKWFENKVVKQGKQQIKDSVDFFRGQKQLLVTNKQGHQIDVASANLDDANKIIVYMPNSNLLSDVNRSRKFYESKVIGLIHLLHIEDYYWLCRYLLTPTELNEYLKFRERIYQYNNEAISPLPEQYVLAHFLNTDEEYEIVPSYINTLTQINSDSEKFDLSGILTKFHETVNYSNLQCRTQYYEIIKEIAKLKRYELELFKSRLQLAMEKSEKDEATLPFRFCSQRTGCGYVFIPLHLSKGQLWENAVTNFTSMYKYKRKLEKCLGVVVIKDSETDYQVYWAFMSGVWEFDQELEEMIAGESKIYGSGKIVAVDRYRFKE